jgi:hypothetical protein
MATKLVQNTCIHNKRKKFNNYLRNVPSKKKGQPTINSNNILPTILKDNNILKLQVLEHNDFTSKLAIIKQMLNMYQNNIIK